MQDELEFGSPKFHCPHCGVLAQQHWFSNNELFNIVFKTYRNIYLDYRVHRASYEQEVISKFLDVANKQFSNYIHLNSLIPESLSIAQCQFCYNYSLWVNKDIVYPRKISIDPPNEDLGKEIKEIYNEASTIFIDSPRGAAAMLRLALQLLLKQLGEGGENINDDIKNLVKKGLNSKIQEMLDVVRVVGNNAVHPGQIDFNDNKEIALKLFQILNLIAQEMITNPKQIDKTYNNVISKETKEQINIRDGKSKRNT